VTVTTGLLESWGVLSEPVLEVLSFSFATVVNTSFVIFRIEDESWVSSDLDSLGLVGGGIELSDN